MTREELQQAIDKANTEEKHIRRRMATQQKKIEAIGQELVTLTKTRAENAMRLAELYRQQSEKVVA